MSSQELSANIKTGDAAGKSWNGAYDIPDDLEEAKSRFGEAVVYSRFKGSLIIDLQSFIRTQLKKKDKEGVELTDEEITTAVGAWEPGVRAAGRPMSEKVGEMLGRLSPQERADILAAYASDTDNE